MITSATSVPDIVYHIIDDLYNDKEKVLKRYSTSTSKTAVALNADIQ